MMLRIDLHRIQTYCVRDEDIIGGVENFGEDSKIKIEVTGGDQSYKETASFVYFTK